LSYTDFSGKTVKGYGDVGNKTSTRYTKPKVTNQPSTKKTTTKKTTTKKTSSGSSSGNVVHHETFVPDYGVAPRSVTGNITSNISSGGGGSGSIPPAKIITPTTPISTTVTHNKVAAEIERAQQNEKISQVEASRLQNQLAFRMGTSHTNQDDYSTIMRNLDRVKAENLRVKTVKDRLEQQARSELSEGERKVFTDRASGVSYEFYKPIVAEIGGEFETVSRPEKVGGQIVSRTAPTDGYSALDSVFSQAQVPFAPRPLPFDPSATRGSDLQVVGSETPESFQERQQIEQSNVAVGLLNRFAPLSGQREQSSTSFQDLVFGSTEDFVERAGGRPTSNFLFSSQPSVMELGSTQAETRRLGGLLESGELKSDVFIPFDLEDKPVEQLKARQQASNLRSILVEDRERDALMKKARPILKELNRIDVQINKLNFKDSPLSPIGGLDKAELKAKSKLITKRTALEKEIRRIETAGVNVSGIIVETAATTSIGALRGGTVGAIGGFVEGFGGAVLGETVGDFLWVETGDPFISTAGGLIANIGGGYALGSKVGKILTTPKSSFTDIVSVKYKSPLFKSSADDLVQRTFNEKNLFRTDLYDFTGNVTVDFPLGRKVSTLIQPDDVTKALSLKLDSGVDFSVSAGKFTGKKFTQIGLEQDFLEFDIVAGGTKKTFGLTGVELPRTKVTSRFGTGIYSGTIEKTFKKSKIRDFFGFKKDKALSFWGSDEYVVTDFGDSFSAGIIRGKTTIGKSSLRGTKPILDFGYDPNISDFFIDAGKSKVLYKNVPTKIRFLATRSEGLALDTSFNPFVEAAMKKSSFGKDVFRTTTKNPIFGSTPKAIGGIGKASTKTVTKLSTKAKTFGKKASLLGTEKIISAQTKSSPFIVGSASFLGTKAGKESFVGTDFGEIELVSTQPKTNFALDVPSVKFVSDSKPLSFDSSKTKEKFSELFFSPTTPRKGSTKLKLESKLIALEGSSLKTSAVLKTKSLLGTSSLLKTDTSLKLDAGLRTDSLLKLGAIPKMSTFSKTDLRTSTVTKSLQLFRTQSMLRTNTLLRTDTLLKAKTKTKIGQFNPLIIIPKVKKPIIPLLPPALFPKTSGSSRFVQGFKVEVRKGGKFKLLSGTILPKAMAKNLGASFVSKTSAATFRLVPTKRKVRKGKAKFSSGLASMFRVGKGKNTFIEKRKYRIDRPMELKEITFKGLSTLRKNPLLRKKKSKRTKKFKRTKKPKTRKVRRKKKTFWGLKL